MKLHSDGWSGLVHPIALVGETVSTPSRRRFTISGALVVVLLGTTGLGQDSCSEGDELTEFLVMRDGIELATEAWTVPGAANTIVMRTPYGRRSNLGYVDVFNAEEWAVVSQDTRGTGESGGVFLSPFDDAWGANQDGYDTVEWAAAQEFSTGDVCLYGFSALTIVNLATAGAAPPSLKCVYAWVGTQDIYGHAVWQGGAFRESLATRWLATLLAFEALDRVMAAPLETDPLWANVRLQTRYDQVDVPIYHVGGWFDIFSQGTLDAYAGIQSGGGAGAVGRQKLLVGPWSHDHEAGQLTFVDAGNPDGREIAWFERWLDDIPNGIDSEAPVTYYLMGDADKGSSSIANRWVDAEIWPPASTPTRWYLQPDGGLSTAAPLAGTAASNFDFNPQDPVPTLGGQNLFIENGSFDQASSLGRDDVLLFETDELVQPVAIAGRIEAELFVSSQALDTDFTVKLMDVYPDGRYMLMNDGIVRMRFRDGQHQETLMVPGEVYQVSVDLWSTALVFEAGHRIAIAVSSSNYPRFDVNPNNGGDLFNAEPTVVAEQTVYKNSSQPSSIVLPVIAIP